MINKNISKKRCHGFTLIEIMLAVFILEIGLLGIAGFYGYSLNVTKMARNQTTAANLASGLLDEQLANSFDTIIVGEGAKTAYSTEINNPFSNFSKKIDIAYIDQNLSASYTESEANKNMKKITVTIYWQEQETERSWQIATIKAKH